MIILWEEGKVLIREVVVMVKCSFHIRWRITLDMPAILAIEEAVFEFPWSEAEFLRCLSQRNCICMVCEDSNSEVVGYMVYELHKNRIHLLNFAVNPSVERSGVGSFLIAKLISKLSLARRNIVTLEVRETNLGAQLFFKKLGFRAISVIRDFSENTREDATFMQCTLQQSSVLL